MIEVLKLLINRPENYQETIKESFKATLQEHYSHDEILRLGPKLMKDKFEWMKDVLEYFKLEINPTPITKENNLIGICYRANGTGSVEMEVSEDYIFDKVLKYRIPAKFSASPAGIYLKTKTGEDLITSTAILPLSVLNIDNGRFISYYKFRTYFSDKTFIESLDTIKRFAPKNKVDLLKEFISLCVYYNSLEPKMIDIVEYDNNNSY